MCLGGHLWLRDTVLDLTDVALAVGLVLVLVQHNLPARGRALGCDDGGPREEDDPQAEPPFAVLGLDLLLVLDPVVVPLLKRDRVVDPHVLDVVHLEPGSLNLVHNKPEGAGGVSSREDVSAHKDAPDKVLEAPGGTQAGNLQVEEAVVLEPVRAHVQEVLEAKHTHVLGHLNTADDIPLLEGDIPVVHQLDRAQVLSSVLLNALVAPGNLLLADGHTKRLGTIVLAGVADQRAPAAANVEQSHAGLELQLLADGVHLALLCDLEGVILVCVHAAGVDHGGAQEPVVEVVAAVVHGLDLVAVHVLAVPQRLGDETEAEVLDVVPGEAEAEQLLAAVLEDLVHVPVDVDLFAEVGLVEHRHGHVLALVLSLELLILERDNGSKLGVDLLLGPLGSGPCLHHHGEDKEGGQEGKGGESKNDGRAEQVAQQRGGPDVNLHADGRRHQVGGARILDEV
eukprot:comp8624_c0_seq1/m.3914 comp8624_c0_seq1/g.3914  ORF comp8624_c0_seq1/g.3914 comp8624_c0_seq1/m.3914 type:complete len:454 (+) comp8624_c0_seq1:695-2056(+)